MKTRKWLCVLYVAGLAFGVAAPETVWGIVYHPSSPGSVLVFHEFLTGTVSDTDGRTLPRSSFEISVVCPPEAVSDEFSCTELIGLQPQNKTVYLKAKWVCPPDAAIDPDPHYCDANNFILKTTVNGTLWINPENISNTGTGEPPAVDPIKPDCPQGFLIVWVIDGPVTQEPISFNGLLGDAILRPTNFTHVAAYNAAAIQSLRPTGLLTSGKDNLQFDAINYRLLTDGLFGTVRYEDANTRTFLTLLSLNMNANTTDNPSNFVDLNFYNELEDVASDAAHVICWKQIDVPSGAEVQGVKGLVSAFNTEFNSLLGMIRTQEVIPNTIDPLTGDPLFRGYAYSMYIDRTTSQFATFREASEQTPIGGFGLPGIASNLLEPSSTTSSETTSSGTTSTLLSLPGSLLP